MFNVCWGGVYLGVRTFLPMLLASEAGHVVNTSSVNGFWATLGGSAHTAYSAAKFAVKGFSEALITDLRVNAPHVQVSVVMPGHIGTSIVFNSGAYFGRDPKELDEAQVADLRERLAAQGLDVATASDEDVRNVMLVDGRGLPRQRPDDGGRGGDDHPRRRPRRRVADPRRSTTPTSSTRPCAPTPTEAYEPEFMERLRAEGVFAAMPRERSLTSGGVARW